MLQLKKTKMPKEVKNVAESYKTTICNEITQLIIKDKPQEHILLGYATALRHFLGQNDEENIPHLLKHLNAYVEYALNDCQHFQTTGYLILFTTVLQNKSKIPEFDDGLAVKFWEACKENPLVYSKFDEYSQLIVLIVGHVGNEGFPDIMKDLLGLSVSVNVKVTVDYRILLV